MRDTTLKSFLCLVLLALFARSAQSPAQKPPTRLAISVDSASTGANKTSAYFTPNDEVFLYAANGTPLYAIQQPKPGGSLVPVFYDVDGTMQLFLKSGDSFSWVLPDGSPYTRPLTFLSANPCGGAVSHTQEASCRLAVRNGTFEYVCGDCSDPRIVVHTSTGIPSIANTLLEIEALAEVSLGAADSTRTKAEALLGELKSAKPPSNPDREQLSRLLTQIAELSLKAKTLAQEVDTDAKRGQAFAPSSKGISSPTTPLHLFPLKVGPQIDLLCADPVGGKASVTVAGWRGDLKELNLTWVNGRNLGDDWSVDHVMVNADDASCANKVFTSDTVYAGTCVAQRQPTAVTFDLHVSSGDCKVEKAWRCTSTTSGGNCTQQ